MAQSLVINGITYIFPDVYDENWGQNVTDWAVAVTGGMLQKAGGSFTLSAEVDFGASFGVKTVYIKFRNSNVASSGQIRMSNLDTIAWRNFANSDNLVLTVDVNDKLLFNGIELVRSGLIVNADISPSAAIAYSKLNLTGGIVNADVNASAGIVYSKLNLAGGIVNADVNASAAIAYSKLNLTGGIVNADVNASAGIVYSKLNLAGGIVNADVNASAAIVRSKLASGNAYRVVTNDASGIITDAAAITASRALISDANGIPTHASTTSTQLGYVSGVTSAIQTQLDGRGFFENRLINGSMMIDQRNAGASTAVSDDNYCFDCWYVLTQTASINVSQQTLQNANVPYNIRLTQNQAAAQRMGIAQIIEGKNCQDFRGSNPTTVYGSVRISNSQLIRWAILEWTGTEDVVTSDVVNDWTSSTYTPGNFFLGSNLVVTVTGSTTPSANTWTNLPINASGVPSSSLRNIIIFIWTSGTAAQNVTLDISNMQFRRGQDPSTFMQPDRLFNTELMLAQRHYQKTYSYGTVAGTVTDAGAYIGIRSTGSTTFTIPLKCVMRAVPTTTFYSPATGTSGKAYDMNAGADVNAVTNSLASDNSVGCDVSIASTGVSAKVHAVFSAPL